MKTPRPFASSWAACLVLLASATPALAQSGSASEAQHRNDCRLAQQVLVHGHPAEKRAWALSYFATCGSMASGIAVEVLRQFSRTTEPDTAFERFVSSASALIDRAVALEAAELASNAGAPRYARIQALRILRGQVTEGELVSYESLVRAPGRVVQRDSAGVTYHFQEHESGLIQHPLHSGTPPNRDDLLAIAARLRSVSRDIATPVDVARAAANVAGVMESAIRVHDQCSGGITASECTRRMRDRPRAP